MKKAVVAVIVLVIVGVGGFVIYNNNKSSSNTNTTSSGSSNSTNSTNSSSSSSDQTASMTGAITMKNMAFTPSQITVAKGGTVTWTNNDDATHTVTDDLSDVGGPASGDIKPGETYSFTFNKTGSFQYHCTIHSSMRGTIVVK